MIYLSSACNVSHVRAEDIWRRRKKKKKEKRKKRRKKKKGGGGEGRENKSARFV